MRSVEIEICPRAQFRAFIESDKRWSCLIVHRRGGKTFAGLQKLLKESLTYRRPGPPKRYAYIAPTRDQAKDIAWNYLKEFTKDIPGMDKNEAELRVTMPDGTMIRLYSGENFERMRGLYFDGVVIDEPEDIDPMAWTAVIRPCLSDYKGWAIWIGTVKGKKGQWKRMTNAMQDAEWFAMLLKASESGIIDPVELASLEREAKREGRHEIFLQEYECDPNIGIPGAVLARFVTKAHEEGRVKNFPWDRSEQVFTFWDLGSPENVRVTYVQFVGREIHVIDHDADLGDPEMTPAKRVAHMNAKGYYYGKHCFPHDAAAREKSGKNFSQQMQEAGLAGITIIPRCHSVWPGINALVEMFPRCLFHKDNTEYLLESMEYYQRRVDREGTVTDDILQNWACHSTDSMRMLAEAMLNGIVKANALHSPAAVTVTTGFRDLNMTNRRTLVVRR